MKNLSAVTTDNIWEAARLHDELGEREFLSRYGFGRSTKYRLELDGVSYPSKAILGVAHEFATGTALVSEEFTGGLQETVRVLERLGLSVSGRPTASGTEAEGRDHATYMLLWNPSNFRWDDAHRLEILDATLDGETVEGQWSIYSNRKQVRVGDRVFLRKTGQHAPGVIASGWVVSEVYTALHWDQTRPGETYYIDIEWDAMLDTEDVLETSALASEFPHSLWTAAGGGASIPDDIAVELERDWARYLEPEIATGGGEDSGNRAYREEIKREYGEVLARRRKHQRAFRKLLLAEREHRCAYDQCDIDEPRILDAAHIIPDSEEGEPVLENGLLMCRNHHRAMDLEMLVYDGAEFHWSGDITPF